MIEGTIPPPRMLLWFWKYGEASVEWFVKPSDVLDWDFGMGWCLYDGLPYASIYLGFVEVDLFPRGNR